MTEEPDTMALTRDQIIDAAMTILRDFGLEDLSMRRLARDLDVQPGALYWHIKNKQDLLTVLAGMILEPVGETASVRELAVAIRRALLSVRDGAEVVALAVALGSDGVTPLLRQRLLDERGPENGQIEWACAALVHYIIGTVFQEQTRQRLLRAGLVEAPMCNADEAFDFGLDLLISGLRRT